MQVNKPLLAARLISSWLRLVFGNLRETIKISEVAGSSLDHLCIREWHSTYLRKNFLRAD